MTPPRSQTYGRLPLFAPLLLGIIALLSSFTPLLLPAAGLGVAVSALALPSRPSVLRI
ncbi:hypothetical protein [Streptomyces griseorubiginosus]|uniref:hypothetical protein n=1 Tax=Streptomyces griseorubiginosus TaxID=67304 RepID=UPI001AD6D671|nr:hypothetical protein [Streptomyces griseorubiginosus]MBO4255458.1 hypothetical protein [Streptomyces griseorubiginosus]